MSKKDYELIAAIIRQAGNDAMGGYTAQGVVTQITQQFAELARADNPRFDRARFMDACGLRYA